MIERATADHADGIRSVLDAAFSPSTFESKLYDCVVSSGDDYHAWVSLKGNEVTGFILYSEAFRDSYPIGYHLAPVAVRPADQRKGIGSALIRKSLEEDSIRRAPVFVLGDPNYYERFGFSKVTSAQCPYDKGNTHFRAIRWTELSEPFDIGYADAFKLAAAEG